MRATSEAGRSRSFLRAKRTAPEGAFEEAVDAGCPVLFLDLDQGLEFTQVMGVAGPVAHALQSEVGRVVVMDDDAAERLIDMAAPGSDAQDGQPRCAQHVEPLGPAGDANAGLVEVLDRGCGADDLCDMIAEGLEALDGAPGHGGDGGCRDLDREEVAHDPGDAHFRNELGVQQVGHPCGDARPVLDRGSHAVREGGRRHGAAGGAAAAMAAMFGDLEGPWLGHIEDLPADRVSVTVSLRQRRAAACC